ncbi:MAG: endonuclease Q family protein [Patescibacteria group bacterium]|nr:endonuclease Q family protein [Patescibacteria group bacterium]
MDIFADLHLHSKYSRACSKNLDLENLSYYASLKGLKILITGDFTHPDWFREIKQKLVEVNDGIYRLKDSQEEVFFLLGGEISSIFSRQGIVKRIHYIVILPKFDLVEKLNKKLSMYSNLRSDGRPILALDVIDFMKILFDIYEKAIFIPAHIWTPWFSLYGSISGFDSIYEAFGQYVDYVTAVETGLSSDPNMNWRLPELDRFSIVSFSDAHSPHPHRLGREATLFRLNELSYSQLYKAMKEPNEENKILMTVEFFPEEGKYHYDGHRLCKVRFSPEDSKKNKYLCPMCGGKVTIGVMSRVEKLAKRPSNFFSENRPPFKRTTPLTQIIGQLLNSEPTSKKVFSYYLQVVNEIGPELDILIDNFDQDLMKQKYSDLLECLEKIRREEIILEPGYDGEYGKVLLNFDNHQDSKKVNDLEDKKLFG